MYHPAAQKDMLTITSTTSVTPNTDPKKPKNAGRAQSLNSSPIPCSSSCTTPNTAISVAPTATSAVPAMVRLPNRSPSISRARRALKMSETAPSGARMTMGRVSSWKMVANMLEVM